jgi:hypothetical protein
MPFGIDGALMTWTYTYSIHRTCRAIAETLLFRFSRRFYSDTFDSRKNYAPWTPHAMPLGAATSTAASAVKSTAGSVTNKTLQFYREVARCLPSILTQYKLSELTTVAQLRRNLSEMIRNNADVKGEGARDVLIYKGREELEMILLSHKQRHHLVRDYVHNPAMDKVEKPGKGSAFLERFYRGA